MRPVQFFSDEYLEQCRKMSPAEILSFLENFRSMTTAPTKTSSRLISMKVPEDMLKAFQQKAKLNGIKYQTQIKKLMSEWLQT